MINALLKDKKISTNNESKTINEAKRAMTIASLGGAVRYLRNKTNTDLNINSF